MNFNRLIGIFALAASIIQTSAALEKEPVSTEDISKIFAEEEAELKRIYEDTKKKIKDAKYASYNENKLIDKLDEDFRKTMDFIESNKRTATLAEAQDAVTDAVASFKEEHHDIEYTGDRLHWFRSIAHQLEPKYHELKAQLKPKYHELKASVQSTFQILQEKARKTVEEIKRQHNEPDEILHPEPETEQALAKKSTGSVQRKKSSRIQSTELSEDQD